MTLIQYQVGIIDNNNKLDFLTSNAVIIKITS